jgi:hypothetical protein
VCEGGSSDLMAFSDDEDDGNILLSLVLQHKFRPEETSKP